MWTDLLYRLRAIFRRDRMDRDLDEELRYHMERQVQKGVARGAPSTTSARATPAKAAFCSSAHRRTSAFALRRPVSAASTAACTET